MKIKRYYMIIFLLISICCGCKKNPLPMPAYPLDEATLEAALQQTGFSWKIESKDTWGQGRIYYELCNEDEKGIAIVSSGTDEGRRFLQINFFSATSSKDVPLPSESFEKAICLAAILYGGFEDENQIYENFQSTYEEKTVIDNSLNKNSKNQKRIRWTNQVNGVECFIGFRQMNSGSDSSETEIVSIQVSGNETVLTTSEPPS